MQGGFQIILHPINIVVTSRNDYPLSPCMLLATWSRHVSYINAIDLGQQTQYSTHLELVDMNFLLSNLLLFLLTASSVTSFNPNTAKQFVGTTTTSRTHKDITESAIRAMAKLFMDEHPDDYPDQDRTMASGDFKQAISHFRTGAAKPDVAAHLAKVPEVHFDDEEIVASNQRLIGERLRVITALNHGNMAGARDLSGQLLHTLQDFYSHTNWVENDGGVHSALGDPGRTEELGTVATAEEDTCSEYLNKT